MKKTFDTGAAMQTIRTVNADLDEDILTHMENAMIGYNDAKNDLEWEFLDGYCLNDLIADYSLQLFDCPVTTRIVKVYDNGGKSIDRYDIVIQTSGEVYGCSSLPQHPQGVGQYTGNVCELVYGHGADFYIDKRGNYIHSWVRVAISEYKKRLKKLSSYPVKYGRLPIEVQNYINYLIN